MEQVTTADVQNKVQEILSKNPALTAYVKKFDVGGANSARKLFPYITVAEVTSSVRPLCIGKNGADIYDFTVIIQAGTRHTLPEVACEGNSSGKKGIVQLVDDIVAALYPGTLDEMLGLLRLDGARIRESGGGGSMAGVITLSGSKKQ